MRQINADGLALIMHFEGCRLNAYHDTRGLLTIGFGHTKGVQEGQTISQDQADSFLQDDCIASEIEVQTHIRVPLTDNQFSALVCLVFNCGAAPLLHHLGEYLNQGNYATAADAFLQWDHCAGNRIQGLTDRREAERNLFLRSNPSDSTTPRV